MMYPSKPLCEPLEPRTLLSAVPNDPAYGRSDLYGLARIGAAAAWQLTTGRASTIVANIDSGIDFAHPDLYLNIYINPGEGPFALGAGGITDVDADGILTFRDLNAKRADGSLINGQFASDLNKNGYVDGEDLVFDKRWSNSVDNDRNGYVDDIVGWDFAHNDNDPFDFHGHGTHTAGTMGAIGGNAVGVVGINWDVRILPLKVFTDDGSGATDRAIAQSIYYAVQQGAKVSNNSYGGSYGYKGDTLYQAISFANQRGHLFVTAAGNEPVNNDSSSRRSYPASYDLPNIISVAASDASDRLASYSAFGRTTVDIAAPGNDVFSTLPGTYGRSTGTSMASPHVAGAAALLFALKPNLAAWQVKYALMLSADKNESLRGKVFSGGRLNIARAASIANGFTPAPNTAAQLQAKASAKATPAKAKASVFNVDKPLHPLDDLPII